ncbi:MAG: acyl carrier protein [Nitrospirota bacterium]|nr:acyl carrier protein [Nitrospirota bacterium]MDE3035259.1 acyl carrier protein [Nitrospirota bacterium]MDE3118111.1 acyl carrier protein [Nitrospirota bacterium]MDE3241833.1 acyl carrier protein [Nitrospirota bacterium]
MSVPLTAEDVRRTTLRVLGEIAPEADLASLKPDVSFRDQLDIDSMDFLNFVIALHEALQVEIPEADYPKLASLNACVEYLLARSAASRRA